jgi:prepilin-type N-terminal cleavage/methylation domain-containing protein
MAFNQKKSRGFTIFESVIVMLVAGILSSALVTIFVPQINLFFYLPQAVRVNTAAQDLLTIIFDGDEKARGLRFSNNACGVPKPGSSMITAATKDSLTYHYSESNQCGGGGTASHSVTITYVSGAGNNYVTRSIDGGAAVRIPYWLVSGTEINIEPFESNADGPAFFRYYNSTPAEMTSATPITTANIYRVDIAARVYSGGGNVKSNEAGVYLKSACEIKRYV